MKKSLFAVFIWFYHSFSFACSCHTVSQVECFMYSDFVAKVQITKVYPNATRQSETFKIDIEILDLFKGQKVKSIIVYGSSDSLYRSSCDMSVSKNSTWMIYARKDTSKVYLLHSCSASSIGYRL